MASKADTESLSLQVVEAVAESTGVEPTQLQPPLYDVINPEALDSLFRNGDGSVTFDYCGRTVTVTNQAEITIES